DSGMCKSSGEARRLIQGGGAYLNDERISDVNFAVKREMLNGSSFILKSGKKNMKKIHIV
ncbi:MAG: tyrosine--tRNA ligase, partial [Lentisphaeria bacterium]|nr:tyrosine--tRNA ligase [Lentisphaeria bacterium]